MALKFRFQFIGPPFSEERPGTTIEVDEWDVPDMRRAAHDWREVSDTTGIHVEPKIIKVKGIPRPVRPTTGGST